MASFVPFSLGEDMAEGAVDFDTHSFKCMVVTSAYNPLQTHTKRSDVTNEVSGTGYTAGGAAITATVSRASGITSISWSTVTFTAADWASAGRRAIIYRDRGGASSADEYIFCADFGVDKPTTGLDYEVSFPSALTITVPTGT